MKNEIFNELKDFLAENSINIENARMRAIREPIDLFNDIPELKCVREDTLIENEDQYRFATRKGLVKYNNGEWVLEPIKVETLLYDTIGSIRGTIEAMFYFNNTSFYDFGTPSVCQEMILEYIGLIFSGFEPTKEFLAHRIFERYDVRGKETVLEKLPTEEIEGYTLVAEIVKVRVDYAISTQ